MVCIDDDDDDDDDDDVERHGTVASEALAEQVTTVLNKRVYSLDLTRSSAVAVIADRTVCSSIRSAVKTHYCVISVLTLFIACAASQSVIHPAATVAEGTNRNMPAAIGTRWYNF